MTPVVSIVASHKSAETEGQSLAAFPRDRQETAKPIFSVGHNSARAAD